jgi:hypothetical protein
MAPGVASPKLDQLFTEYEAITGLHENARQELIA